MVLVVFVLASVFHDHAQSEAINELEQVAGLPAVTGKTFTCPAIDKHQDALIERLSEQYAAIMQGMKGHKEAMKWFYSKHYAAILETSIAAVIAALILLVISKSGWDNTNEYLIALFLYVSAVSLFFLGEPLFLKAQENFSTNKVLFLAYSSLADELKSYCVTGQRTKRQKSNAKDFISQLDEQVVKTRDIAMTLDQTSVLKVGALAEQLIPSTTKQP
jgi:hypothetical protein